MSDKIKEFIASELSEFLVKEDKLPEKIKVELQYEGATAQISISRERLEELLNKGKFFTPGDVRAMTAAGCSWIEIIHGLRWR